MTLRKIQNSNSINKYQSTEQRLTEVQIERERKDETSYYCEGNSERLTSQSSREIVLRRRWVVFNWRRTAWSFSQMIMF